MGVMSRGAVRAVVKSRRRRAGLVRSRKYRGGSNCVLVLVLGADSVQGLSHYLYDAKPAGEKR